MRRRGETCGAAGPTSTRRTACRVATVAACHICPPRSARRYAAVIRSNCARPLASRPERCTGPPGAARGAPSARARGRGRRRSRSLHALGPGGLGRHRHLDRPGHRGARSGRAPALRVSVEDGRAIGSSSYLDIAPVDGRLEIGATWYGRAWWRTFVNPESKLLLLGHAFDELGATRVAFRTDAANERSRSAIERLGAVFEGIHRHREHRPDGTLRDTAFYSILADEWPAVRAALDERLANV
jgi:N-acetyltransferase